MNRPNSLGAVGPTARASGVARDVRVDAPYAAYPDFPVKLVTDDARRSGRRVLWCASRSCLRATG